MVKEVWIELPGERMALQIERHDDGTTELSLIEVGLRLGHIYTAGSATLDPDTRRLLRAALED